MADLVDVEYCEVDILVRTISLAFSTSKRFSGTVSYSRISLELSKTKLSNCKCMFLSYRGVHTFSHRLVPYFFPN